MKAVQFSSVTGQANAIPSEILDFFKQRDIFKSQTNAIPQEILDGPSWMLDVYASLPHFCSYDDIARVTNMNRGSIANFHSEGRGPRESLLIGKKRCFPRLAVINWIMAMDEEKGA